jgi:type II secretory pathway component PulF
MMYPSIVLIVFFIIGFLVISFILPRLTAMIKDLNADIPWYTAVIITVGDFMSKYWWAVAFIIMGVIGSVVYYIKTPDGRKEWDQVKINLPVVGIIFRYVYIVRFSENLAVLLAGGIPIVRALDIVSTVINNSVYEAIFVKTSEQVKIGGNIHSVLERSELIPPVVSHMIRIGEESGQIESVLGHISRFYEQETEMMTKNLSTLLEPVLMIIIGVMVGFMAVAVIMPIYDIAGQIN